ncbi:MAG: DUF378 domain-containing protein [Christensenellaceae bacterium]|jgi:uncharacterized membrane protein YuzA (DUF378 family)|nr:DUF378 domain-containing protein [Christensenellaceae bacterium]
MNKVMKWLNTVAFTILLIGGLNYLFMGLFGFDMFGTMFGDGDGMVGRLFYSLFGISSLILLITVIARTVMNNKKS